MAYAAALIIKIVNYYIYKNIEHNRCIAQSSAVLCTLGAGSMSHHCRAAVASRTCSHNTTFITGWAQNAELGPVF